MLYIAGALAALCAAFVDPGRSGLLFAIGAVGALTGAVVLRWGRRLPRSALHALVAAGTLLISAAVLLAPASATALVLASVYVFVALDVFYFFSGPPAFVQLALLLVAAAGTLRARDVPLGLVAVFVVVLVAVVVVLADLARRAGRANRDPLTGLWNRRGFDAELEGAVAEATRAGTPLSLALLDVDRFKAVNDAHGHPGGDLLLQVLAQELTTWLPAPAVVGRFGGDEFTVLLPRTGGDGAVRSLEAARAAAHHPVSVGVVELLAGESPGELLRRADAALYEAKQRGRGRVVHGDAGAGRDLSWSRMGPVVETPTKTMQVVPVVEVARKRFELPGRYQVRVQAAQEAEVVRWTATARQQAPRVAGREAGHRSRQVRQRWAVRAETSPRLLVPARRAALAQAQKLQAVSFPTPVKVPMKGTTLRQRMAALKAAELGQGTRSVSARDVARRQGRDPGGRGR